MSAATETIPTADEFKKIVERKYGWYLAQDDRRSRPDADIVRKGREDVASLRRCADPEWGVSSGFRRQSAESCAYWAGLADTLEKRIDWIAARL